MIIDYTKSFTKQYKKLPVKVQNEFKYRLTIFAEDASKPILHHHALRGKKQGFYSINITGYIRALYYKKGSNIIFALIGTHSQLN